MSRPKSYFCAQWVKSTFAKIDDIYFIPKIFNSE